MRPTARHIRGIAAGVNVLALAVPAAANAATIGYEGDTLVLRAAPGEANSVTAGVNGEGQVQLSDHASGYAGYGAPVAQILDGGPGDDEITAAEGDDVVRGGPGTDVIDAGAGNDAVDGGDGDDTVSGDRYGDPGNDVVEGGPGFDTLDDYDNPGADHNPPITLSYDGPANDGRPGEADNVGGIEKFESHVNGTFTGGPGDDELFAWAASDVCGIYYCRIPFGNDVINARDGQLDRIDCGAGEDRVVADAVDVIAPNCEQVEKGSGGPGGASVKPGGLSGPSSFTRKALKRGIAFTHACTAACTVTVKLVADKATARKLGTRTIANGKGKRASAGTVKVRAKRTRVAKRRLGRLRRGRATLKVTVTDGGATQRFAKAVTIKR